MAEGNSQLGRRQPISRHPLFPAIVALWFAAPLALGSFALSVSALETLVLAGHIDSLVPAAAPPLGMTARLALALALGFIGALVGWVLARRLAAPKHHTVPQVFKVADADLDASVQWPGMAGAASGFQPSRFEPVMPESIAPEPVAAEEPAPLLDPASLAVDAIDAVPEPLAVGHVVIPAERGAQPASTAAQRIAAADLRELSHVELVERLAIGLQRRQDLLGSAAGKAADPASGVIQFPDFADRRSARQPLPAVQPRLAPQETEKALREALAQLQRMSGGA
ncbi:MAG: hypothetical protein JF595_16150 [Sphingomonadales bacterium]|nr:hypothetical protein [Sphingomonadales bacterium]